MSFVLNIFKKFNIRITKEKDLPQYLYYGDLPFYIQRRLQIVDADSSRKRELFKNTSTGQLWVIDEWDKDTFEIAIAIKIRSSVDWKLDNYGEYQKDLLFQSRGGFGEGKCMWMNCNKQRVKGVVHCIDHLYEMGARK